MVRVYQPLILGTRGVGEPRTHLLSTCYSSVGGGSPGAARLSNVSPSWAQSKGENGGLMNHRIFNMTTTNPNQPTSNERNKKRRADESLIIADENMGSAEVFTPFLVAEPTTEKQIDLSIFGLQKYLICALGEVKSAKKLRNGSVLIEVFSKGQAEKALAMKVWLGASLNEIPVRVTPHRSLNSSKGVIRCRDLRDSSDEEVLEALQPEGVTNVKHIMTKRNGTLQPTNTFVLTFAKPSPPKSVKAAYLHIPVEPFIPNPLRCYNCQKFGHGKTSCQHVLVCARCGKEGHADADCHDDETRCVNCSGSHPAYSKECPEWAKQHAIIKIKTERNISFTEAKQLHNQQINSLSKYTVSYATACKTATCSVSTQTDFTWPLDADRPALTKLATSHAQTEPIDSTKDLTSLGAAGGNSINTSKTTQEIPSCSYVPRQSSTPKKKIDLINKPGPLSSRQAPGNKLSKGSDDPIKVFNKYGSLESMDLEVYRSPMKGSGSRKKT